MSEGKVEITLGAVQIKCEGSEDFLQKELPKLLNAVADFHNKTHGQITQPKNDASEAGEKETNDHQTTKFNLATQSICAKLGGKNASDVTLAASAHLHFVKEKTTFTRDDLAAEIKNAKGYYKTSMTGNLTQTINSLVNKNKFNVVAGNKYELAASEVNRIQSVLSK